MHIIDGKALSSDLRKDIKEQVSQMSRKPGLAVILVGNDPASEVYVGRKIRACEQAGILSFERRLSEDISQEDLIREIELLNQDSAIDGILLQLPLPAHLEKNPALQAIDPLKDVDGLHPRNIGKLTAGQTDGFVPCTPLGAMKLIKSVKEDLTGMHALVIGCSLLFGRPMGQLFLQEDATVTFAHRHTRNLPELCRQADIVTVAVGKPNLVQGDWIKEGAIIIDVGINRTENGDIVGDVDYEGAKDKAGAITPVPGGVGPMTIACLLKNTLKSAQNRS